MNVLRRARKLARILAVPEYRAGVRHGSFATTEHEAISFGHDFRSVVDVGAHYGEFALFAARRFPAAAIYCVEPLAEAQAKLRGLVPRAEVIPYAAAATAGRRTLHVSRASAASSLLPLTRTLAAAFPGTEEAEVREIDARPLDELVDLDALAPPALLKVDVQGAELDVLRGAERLLAFVDEALVECSFVELYEGQALAADVIDFLRARGFTLAGVYSLLHDRKGRTLQADLLFARAA